MASGRNRRSRKFGVFGKQNISDIYTKCKHRRTNTRTRNGVDFVGRVVIIILSVYIEAEAARKLPQPLTISVSPGPN